MPRGSHGAPETDVPVGRASVLLLDLANPYRHVELRGDAVITPDDDYAFADHRPAGAGAHLGLISLRR